MNVSLLDWYLVVALPEIQLAEDAASLQPGGEILDVGQRVGVWHCGEVQSAVIAAGPPCPVRLHHHVKRCKPVAGGPPDDAVLLQLGELGLGGHQFGRIQAAEPPCGRRPGGL